MSLRKATLQEISNDNPPPVEVQFNPTTLRLAFNNQAEGGKSRGKQTRQFLGPGSTALTLDLVFDTADEGGEEPSDVRKKTALVEKFVVPKIEGSRKRSPPRVRFQWGNLVIEGVAENVSVDFDHFAPNGTPLRAKVGLTVREQELKYQFAASDAGTSQKSAPLPGGAAGGAPGSAGRGGDRSALSLAGESAADFAARMGLDPAAWRGLAGGLDSTLSLQAGVEIGFSADLNLGTGLGGASGVQAGISASLETNLGMGSGVGASGLGVGRGAGSGTDLDAGMKLCAAGGLGSALEAVKIVRSSGAQEQARQAFLAPTGPTTSAGPSGAPARALPSKAATRWARSDPSEEAHMPLHRLGLPAPGANALSAPLPPRVDSRAVTFALGVPVRPLAVMVAESCAGRVGGSVSLSSKSGTGDPPLTNDPTTPRWKALPGPASSSEVKPKRRMSAGPCGCNQPCAHTRGSWQ